MGTYFCLVDAVGRAYIDCCLTQCNNCKEYQSGKGRYAKGAYPMPAIPLVVEYAEWMCVHGHNHIMISMQERRQYEDDGVSSSIWRCVHLW